MKHISKFNSNMIHKLSSYLFQIKNKNCKLYTFLKFNIS